MTAVNADRPPLADTGGLTDADSQSIAWLRAHVCFLVALLSFGGAGLLIASEITDRLERVEGDLEPTALNLAIATPLALLVVSLAALLGDSLLARAERRSGRRPGARLLGPLLTVAGGAVGSAIIVYHVRHAVALDGWMGLSGSALLLLAALAHHRLPRTPHKPSSLAITPVRGGITSEDRRAGGGPSSRVPRARGS